MKNYLEEKLGASLANSVKLVTEPDPSLTDADFAVLKQDAQTVIYAPIASFFKEALDKYLAEGELFREAKYVTDKIYYSDFGAVGDGKNEDISSLRSAHEYANACGRHTVCGNAGAKYYIEKTGLKPIEIATSANWEGVEFIIDDRFITDTEETRLERVGAIFNIIPEYATSYNKENDPLGIIARINEQGGIKTDDTHIPLNLGFDALIGLVNSEKTLYKRWDPYTKKTGKGGPQQEVVVVRADNSIDQTTKTLFDYAGIDRILISRCDTPQITLKGGRFVTIATREDLHWNYIGRYFRINRSNVTIDGMDHYVDNQPLGKPVMKKLSGYERLIPVTEGGGPNYSGWLFTFMAHNLLVINTKLCGRAHYNNGSYDIGGSMTNKTVFKNCTQYNMYDESGKVYDECHAYWGIHGTNYCKNIEFEDCVFSRFDAHAGVYNVRLSGCKLGKVNAVGGGTLLIENTTVHFGSSLTLREDYATSWRGDVIFRNVTLDTNGIEVEAGRLISGTIHNADYGYDTMIPNIIVDNVKWNKKDFKSFSVCSLYRDASFHDENAEKYNHIIPAERIIIRNQEPGYEIETINRDGTTDLFKEVIYE
jgi:hypothetical protein